MQIKTENFHSCHLTNVNKVEKVSMNHGEKTTTMTSEKEEKKKALYAHTKVLK